MKIVDSQWHWHPPALMNHHLQRVSHPRARRTEWGYIYEVSENEIWNFTPDFYDLDTQVRALDAAGIHAAIVSASVAGDVNDRSPGEAKELCSLLNEEMAQAQQSHPGRFYGLAVLPLKDVEAALDVLDEAIERLGLWGILLPSNVDGDSIANPELKYLYEKSERLQIPLFLHPTRSFRQGRVTPYRMEIPIGWMFDTSFATMSLIVSGMLDEYPQLKIVHPHMGGTLPYLHARVEVYRQQGLWPNLDRPFVEYLQQLYFDTVCEEPESLDLVMRVIGGDRLLFSSDYPYWSAKRGVSFVKDNVPGEHLEGVLGGNVLSLLHNAPNAAYRSSGEPPCPLSRVAYNRSKV